VSVIPLSVNLEADYLYECPNLETACPYLVFVFAVLYLPSFAKSEKYRKYKYTFLSMK